MEADEDSLMSLGPLKSGSRVRRVLSRHLPILRWGARYTRLDAAADAVAGATLGLTLVPQSIAYAALAGLPVQYGLYSSFVGTILYTFLGTVKEVSIGPTSLMALLVLQSTHGLPLEAVPLLALLSGLVVLAMGLLRLDFLVELISPVVTSGFTSVTAALIVASQLKSVLGLRFSAETLPENLVLIVRHWHEVRAPDLLLALTCCAALLALRKVKDIRVSEKRPGLKKALWLLSISRNALVVVAAAAVAAATYTPGEPTLFKLSGRVEGGLPHIGLSLSARHNNETVSLWQLTRALGPAPLITPLVMVIANIAIAKAFSVGRAVEARQEMVTLGVANVCGALLCRAMPTCGAFTRSAVCHASGARSPAAGAYAGVISLLALMFLTEYFFFIPRATLAAVLICAVIFMIDFSIPVSLWRTDRAQLLVLSATVGGALCGPVETAVPAGAAADLALLLYRTATHTAVQVQQSGDVCVVRVCAPLVYLNVERALRDVTSAAAAVTHLDLTHCAYLDYSAVKAIERAIKKCRTSGQQLVVTNASAAAAAALAAAGVAPEVEATPDQLPLLTVDKTDQSEKA